MYSTASGTSHNRRGLRDWPELDDRCVVRRRLDDGREVRRHLEMWGGLDRRRQLRDRCGLRDWSELDDRCVVPRASRRPARSTSASRSAALASTAGGNCPTRNGLRRLARARRLGRVVRGRRGEHRFFREERRPDRGLADCLGFGRRFSLRNDSGGGESCHAGSVTRTTRDRRSATASRPRRQFAHGTSATRRRARQINLSLVVVRFVLRVNVVVRLGPASAHPRPTRLRPRSLTPAETSRSPPASRPLPLPWARPGARRR